MKVKFFKCAASQTGDQQCVESTWIRRFDCYIIRLVVQSSTEANISRENFQAVFDFSIQYRLRLRRVSYSTLAKGHSVVSGFLIVEACISSPNTSPGHPSMISSKMKTKWKPVNSSKEPQKTVSPIVRTAFANDPTPSNPISQTQRAQTILFWFVDDLLCLYPILARCLAQARLTRTPVHKNHVFTSASISFQNNAQSAQQCSVVCTSHTKSRNFHVNYPPRSEQLETCDRRRSLIAIVDTNTTVKINRENSTQRRIPSRRFQNRIVATFACSAAYSISYHVNFSRSRRTTIFIKTKQLRLFLEHASRSTGDP